LRQHRASQAEEKLRLGAAYLDHGLVFATAEGKPLAPSLLNRAFTRALAQAGVPRIRLHDSRHGYATWMLQAGVPLKVVSDQLGHSSITITGDVYAHVTREIAQTAADTLNRVFTSGQ